MADQWSGAAAVITWVAADGTPWQDPADYLRHRIADVSLMHGWLPPTVHAAALVLLVCAVRWRSGRWWTRSMPIAVGIGALLLAGLYWLADQAPLTTEPVPPALRNWLALTGIAAGLLAVGWRTTPWWRRGSSVAATLLCLLSAALVLNAWVGYVPTVYSLWNQLTAGPLPDQTDAAGVAAMRLTGVTPAHGVVVAVSISDDASKFRHRGELVYLPPAWFATTPPPPLPVVMMVGAEINTPADWVRIGAAATTADAFAAAHAGNAPVLVFVDSGGAFGVDTECVNGSRGRAADHLTRDVVPFMVSSYGVSADAAKWGVAGFSTGGTCALDLTVMHPELFSAFIDIAGDAGPNAGNKEQTINQLFGGDAAAWADFDPATVIIRHGPYQMVSGWFAVPPASDHRADVGAQHAAANALCRLGRTRGIDCAVVTQAGNHDWPFAAKAFTAALPWLAGRLGTPHVPRINFLQPPPMPGPSTVDQQSTVEAAFR